MGLLSLPLALLILLVAALVLVETGQILRAPLVVQAQLLLLLSLVFVALAPIGAWLRPFVLVNGPAGGRQNVDMVMPQMVRIQAPNWALT